MRFRKKILKEQDHCYAVSVMDTKEGPYVFYAAENKGPCYAWDCASLSNERTVWDGPGGTMSMVPLPGKKGEFLAVQKFFRLYDWEEACLTWVKEGDDGGFKVKELFTLPYLHRFDILQRNGNTWLIACTLAEHKKTREDWEYSGKVYAALLPEDLSEDIKLSVLKDDLYQNHGYARITKEGYDTGLVTCREGVYEFVPPETADGEWKIEKLMPQPTSDADMIDIDDDGEPEIATIEEFHGCWFRIYKKIDGAWKMVFQHPEVTEFYHVVKAGWLCGKPVFVGGCRRGKKQLFIVYWDNASQGFIAETVDEGVGPSNAVIYNGENGDMIFSADREDAKAAVYFVEKD